MKKKGIIGICSLLVSVIMIFNMVAVNVFAEETVPDMPEEILQEYQTILQRMTAVPSA